MNRAFVMESVETVRSKGRNTATIHYIVLRIVQDQNLDFIVNFKIMNLVRLNVEMEFKSLKKVAMMGIMLMGMDVNHIVQLRVAGVVQVKPHLFARNLFVETVSKKDLKIAMTENPTQMKMTRSTVKMIAQDLLPGIDVTQNLHLNAKLVETV